MLRLSIPMLIVAALFATPSLQSQEIDATLQARFLADAPKAWKAYSQEIRRYQGSFSFEVHSLTDSFKVQNQYILKARNNSKILTESAKRTGSQNDYDTFQVAALNPDYAFELGHAGKLPLKKRGFVDLRKGQDASAIHSRFEQFYADVSELINFHDTPLVELVALPSFKILTCKAIESSGDKLVEIHFECPQAYDAKNPRSSLQGGSMILDPERSWTLKSYEYRLKTDKVVGTRKYELEERASGDHSIPLPKKSIVNYESELEGGIQSKSFQIMDFNLSIPSKLPAEDEFNLSTFGFEEP